ncbi:MAG: hypothetical protein OXF41_11765 [bacterium]|nr:hypothetical protein [bacterium]
MAGNLAAVDTGHHLSMEDTHADPSGRHDRAVSSSQHRQYGGNRPYSPHFSAMVGVRQWIRQRIQIAFLG